MSKYTGLIEHMWKSSREKIPLESRVQAEQYARFKATQMKPGFPNLGDYLMQLTEKSGLAAMAGFAVGLYTGDATSGAMAGAAMSAITYTVVGLPLSRYVVRSRGWGNVSAYEKNVELTMFKVAHAYETAKKPDVAMLKGTAVQGGLMAVAGSLLDFESAVPIGFGAGALQSAYTLAHYYCIRANVAAIGQPKAFK